MDDFIIPPDVLSTMYRALADAQPDGALREALRTVRDAVDMGVIPDGVLTDVVLGRRSIGLTMLDLAGVQEDSIADGDIDSSRTARRQRKRSAPHPDPRKEHHRAPVHAGAFLLKWPE